jgi:hypothetical protein
VAGGVIIMDGAEDADITMDGVEGVIAVGDKTRFPAYESSAQHRRLGRTF